MKLLKNNILVITLSIIATLLCGCGGDDDGTTPEDPSVNEPQGVLILKSGEYESSKAVGYWQETIELDTTSLLIINANARARYSGNTRNAGIALYIRLNDELLASDFSFEAQSNTISFEISASTTVFLQPGTYILEVERANIGVNSLYSLRANYFAVLAVED